MIIAKQYMVIQSQGIKIRLGMLIIPSLACIDMHYFCSLISFSIPFRNTVFLVSILKMRHYKLSINSCIRYFFGLSYSILSVFTCKVKQRCR